MIQVVGFSRRCEVILVTIASNAAWHPGQHMRIRAPGIIPVSSPFSIASDPKTGVIKLVVRVKRGVSRSLLKQVRNGETTQLLPTAGTASGPCARIPVVISGPYARCAGAGTYGSATFILGGTGAACGLVVALNMAQRAGTVKRITVFWTLNVPSVAEAMGYLGASIMRTARENGIYASYNIHVTDTTKHRRLDVGEVVRSELDTCRELGLCSVGVFTCGPDGLRDQVRIAAVGAQHEILAGALHPVQEVALENLR